MSATMHRHRGSAPNCFEVCPEAYNPTELGALRREGDWVHWWHREELLCRSDENFVHVTSNPEVFREWEAVGLTCRECTELRHS